MADAHCEVFSPREALSFLWEVKGGFHFSTHSYCLTRSGSLLPGKGPGLIVGVEDSGEVGEGARVEGEAP